MTAAALWGAVGCLAVVAFVVPLRHGRSDLARLLPSRDRSHTGGPTAVPDGDLAPVDGRAVAPPVAPVDGGDLAPGVPPAGGRGGRWRCRVRGSAPRGEVRRAAAAVSAGVAVGVLVGGWVGIACGIAGAVAAYRGLRRLEPAAVRAGRQRCAADLPLAADLVAAALRAGAPVDRAVTAVAQALAGPLGDRLVRVGRSLRLGAEPDEAWEHLADVPGAGRLAAAAERSAASGAALAGALSRLADDLRADRAVALEAAARRAGVLMVLPLGLCFLPAFILAGLVPVIVAVLGDVL